MARQKIKTRPPVVDAPEGQIPVIRGDTNIKPPSAEEINKMKKRQFMRKHPHTSV